MTDQLRIEIGLNAAIVAMVEKQPAVLLVNHENKHSLPYGQFDPLHHRTMEERLRSLVEEQTGLKPGYVDQLYTFGDRGRMPVLDDNTPHVVSVGYLTLSSLSANVTLSSSNWSSWYEFFPWEDWRAGKPQLIEEIITPQLHSWVACGATKALQTEREERAALCFGGLGLKWDEEKVLERYELLYEVGLVEEAQKDGKTTRTTPCLQLGISMHQDHRRILATALSRLRGKLKYRPVVFELMPASFTLFQLQKCVEAISGLNLHKQNFRRQVERTGLVEETGHMSSGTEGRPAKIFRFRPSVMRERLAPGLRVSSPAHRL